MKTRRLLCALIISFALPLHVNATYSCPTESEQTALKIISRLLKTPWFKKNDFLMVRRYEQRAKELGWKVVNGEKNIYRFIRKIQFDLCQSGNSNLCNLTNLLNIPASSYQTYEDRYFDIYPEIDAALNVYDYYGYALLKTEHVLVYNKLEEIWLEIKNKLYVLHGRIKTHCVDIK